LRSYLNPESTEENGYLRLSQRCARCAYVSTTSATDEDIASDNLVCQRHGQNLTLEEAMSFTCDYFC
jgi:hypothetical protein